MSDPTFRNPNQPLGNSRTHAGVEKATGGEKRSATKGQIATGRGPETSGVCGLGDISIVKQITLAPFISFILFSKGDPQR